MTTYSTPPDVNGLVLNFGDILDVNSGGTASSTISYGGTENVYAGGTDIGATINFSSVQYVFSGGASTSATINGAGTQYVYSGGTANSTTINSGGTQDDYGTATNTTINTNGLQIVYPGGASTSATINGGRAGFDVAGTQDDYGTSTNTTINGGVEHVYSGGLANNVTFFLFPGTHSTLELATPSGLTGTITNWQIGDVIDMLNPGVTSVSETGSTLTVTYGSNQTVNYTLAGQQSGTAVILQSDGAGGTDLILTQPTVAPDLTHATFGTTINVAAAGVLANDTPAVTGDTLTVSAVDGLSANVGQPVAGAYGTLTLDADGSYTYSASGHSALPSSGVSEDFFGYTALEKGTAGGASASSTLAVVVTAPGLTVAAPAGGSATQPNGGHYAVLDGTAGHATLNAASGIGAALVGGNGDTLNGATSGKDTFVFMGDFGANTVNNYIGKASGNFDVIQLSISDFKTIGAVMTAAVQNGSNTVITDPSNHDTITLAGVSLTSLHFDASHFLLV